VAQITLTLINQKQPNLVYPNRNQTSQFSEAAERRASESLPSGTLSQASAAENQEGSVAVTPVKNLSSLRSGRQVIRVGRSPTTFTRGEGASASDPLVWQEEPDQRDPLLAPQLNDPGGSGESVLAIPSRYSTDQGRRDSGLSTSFPIYREATQFGVSDSEESVSSLEAVEEEGSSEDSESEDQVRTNSSFSSSDEEMAAVGCKYVTVPAFLAKPGEDADKWLERFEEAATYNNWDDEKMCRNVYVALDGAAKAWANRMKNGLNPPERWSKVQYAAQQTRQTWGGKLPQTLLKCCRMGKAYASDSSKSLCQTLIK